DGDTTGPGVSIRGWCDPDGRAGIAGDRVSDFRTRSSRVADRSHDPMAAGDGHGDSRRSVDYVATDGYAGGGIPRMRGALIIASTACVLLAHPARSRAAAPPE